MTAPVPALSVEGCSRRFGGLWAVKDVSLAVEGGMITGLIGPNGAGKSTLVGLISGLLELTDGDVLLHGQSVSRLEPDVVARRGVARTFQNIRLFGGMTALENVTIGLLGRSSTRDGSESSVEERSREMLARVGMDTVAHRVASDLPYGHQRLVEIARALALDPAVLLLDEPVAGMAEHEADEVRDLLFRLRSDGLGILLIEHNVRFVMECSDVLYVLQQGEIIAQGPPAEVRTDPRVVDAYLGSDG